MLLLTCEDAYLCITTLHITKKLVLQNVSTDQCRNTSRRTEVSARRTQVPVGGSVNRNTFGASIFPAAVAEQNETETGSLYNLCDASGIVITYATISVVTPFCQFSTPSPIAIRLFVYAQSKIVVSRRTRDSSWGRGCESGFESVAVDISSHFKSNLYQTRYCV